jgi:hypothetical protein
LDLGALRRSRPAERETCGFSGGWKKAIQNPELRISLALSPQPLSGRAMARGGLRMMPTFASLPYNPVRRVFLGTASRLLSQTGPSCAAPRYRAHQFASALGARRCQHLFRQLGFRLGKPRPLIAHADDCARAVEARGIRTQRAYAPRL